MAEQWSVHDAKQQFSRVLRAATEDGPQFVTRHGTEVAVILDIAAYRRLAGSDRDFKDFLLSGPKFDDLDLGRDRRLGRGFEFVVDHSAEHHFDEPDEEAR